MSYFSKICNERCIGSKCDGDCHAEYCEFCLVPYFANS